MRPAVAVSPCVSDNGVIGTPRRASFCESPLRSPLRAAARKENLEDLGGYDFRRITDEVRFEAPAELLRVDFHVTVCPNTDIALSDLARWRVSPLGLQLHKRTHVCDAP